MSEVTTLYLHGLGRTDLRSNERRILERNHSKGIDYVAADIDWRSSETFLELRDRITKQASELLVSMSELGRLVIEGSSAGGSLATNVGAQLDDSRVRVVSHSGRLREGNYSKRSWRNLARCAHLGTTAASQSFYDSVLHCDNVTIPSLSEEAKSRMLITMPLADEVVPIATMGIEGVQTARVSIVGHSFGIGAGMLRMPHLIEQL